jgi:hypothetical protein
MTDLAGYCFWFYLDVAVTITTATLTSVPCKGENFIQCALLLGNCVRMLYVQRTPYVSGCGVWRIVGRQCYIIIFRGIVG